MYKVLILSLILFFLSPVRANVITGEIEYNTIGGNEFFFYSSENINFEKIKTKLIDNNYTENLNFLYRGITDLKDRKLAKFSDGSYGILFYDDPMYTWYYSQSGKLINFSKKDSDGYPCRVTKYKPDGSIINTGYRISKTESYIYAASGELIAHWVDNTCYDKNNNVIMHRIILE